MSFLVLLAAAIIIMRLFYIQIIHGNEYSESADRQYATPYSHVFDRGSIFFKERDGSLIAAASLQSGYVLTISPKEIKEEEATYEKLNSVIPINRELFILKAGKKSDPYEEITHRVSKNDADKISAQKIPGVSLYKEKWRFYPAEKLAAHALGFVAYMEDDLGGRYGVERFYNAVLDRKGSELYVNFFAEVFANLKDSLFTDADKREGDLVLTIDPAIQSELEKELVALQEKYSSQVSGGIIINPKDGSIYAMAKMPAFNLNNFQEEKNSYIFSNPIVEDVYEMGSIIKPLTMAAALDRGAINATSTYKDSVSLTLNNYTIYNYDKKNHGTVNMQSVLNQSLNLGIVFVMQKLGKERLKDYFLAYGFGEKTGIDLPNEGRNLISNLYTDRDIEFANASFGQGIALTPISAVRALSSLSNGGYLITPHIVEKIDYKTGLSDILPYPKGRQVLKPATSEEITRMLVEVVDSTLLGKEAKMVNYSIAAKTGTAQLETEDKKGYYDDRFFHSLFGYFPAYNPSFLVFLYTRDPKGEIYASHTLKQSFMNLTKFLISYYELPPDR